MSVAVAVLAILAFLGWVIFRTIKEKSLKSHFVCYGVAIISGIFTYAYFLSMEFPQLIKIVVSILLGIILIVVGALYQRRVAGRS